MLLISRALKGQDNEREREKVWEDNARARGADAPPVCARQFFMANVYSTKYHGRIRRRRGGPPKRKIYVYTRARRATTRNTKEKPRERERESRRSEWNASAVWITFLTRDNHGREQAATSCGPVLAPTLFDFLALVFARDTHSAARFPIFSYVARTHEKHAVYTYTVAHARTELASANSRHHYTTRAKYIIYFYFFVKRARGGLYLLLLVCLSKFLSKNKLDL